MEKLTLLSIYRLNRLNQYVLSVATVLLFFCGRQVSFYTTVGDIEDYFWGLGIVGLKLNL
jgi:hypothetical protein